MVDQSTYTKQYRYKFGYIFKQGDIVVPMNENEYFMPNAWIIDAVNLAVPTVYEWNIISARLDKGFTYCGNVDFDEARYNKAVVRKRNENGWIDTNNSTNASRQTLFHRAQRCLKQHKSWQNKPQ